MTKFLLLHNYIGICLRLKNFSKFSTSILFINYVPYEKRLTSSKICVEHDITRLSFAEFHFLWLTHFCICINCSILQILCCARSKMIIFPQKHHRSSKRAVKIKTNSRQAAHFFFSHAFITFTHCIFVTTQHQMLCGTFTWI